MRYLLSIFCLLIAFGLAAQPEPDIPKKAVKAFEEARYMEGLGNYDAAAEAYEKVMKIVPDFVYGRIMYGEMFVEMGKLPLAKAQFEKAAGIPSKYQDKLKLRLGEICHQMSDIEEAEKYYKEFLNSGFATGSSKKEAELALKSINFAKQSMANPLDITPEKIAGEVNSINGEYFPSLTVDGAQMIFTRMRLDVSPSHEDLFISYADDEDSWGTPINLGPNVNAAKTNEGAHSISPDGKYLFYTYCPPFRGMGSCDIFMSKRVGDEFTTPVKMGPPVNTGAYETQPTMTATGRELYFVSDRKGGFGGTDIYKVNINEKGEFSEAINLGEGINTAGDEQRPFVHPNGKKLYFSSGGHIGVGGLDLFVSELMEDKSWSAPVNMGYPINTPGDELSIFISSDGSKAYTASMVDDKTHFDIYSYDLPVEVQPDPVSYVKGIVFDEKTKKELKAFIQLIDLETGEVVYRNTSDPVNGGFLVSLVPGKDYMYNVSKKDYLFHSENFSLKEETDVSEPFLINIGLKKFEVGKKVVLNNIFFDSGQAAIRPESTIELDKLAGFLNKNTSLKIEIGGHTDNVGSEADNQALSERRALSVVSYLSQQGVDRSRLTAVGYGEVQPIASNDDDIGKQINRRTEFKVLEN